MYAPHDARNVSYRGNEGWSATFTWLSFEASEADANAFLESLDIDPEHGTEGANPISSSDAEEAGWSEAMDSMTSVVGYTSSKERPQGASSVSYRVVVGTGTTGDVIVFAVASAV